MYKILIMLLALSVNRLNAYIDPGTGSFIFQIIIAGLVGGLYAIKVFWRQIVGFCSRILKRGSK